MRYGKDDEREERVEASGEPAPELQPFLPRTFTHREHQVARTGTSMKEDWTHT